MKQALHSSVFLIALFGGIALADEAAHYQRLDLITASAPVDSRSTDWKPGDGITMEVSGMEWIGPDRLAVAVRKGEIWFVDHPMAEKLEDIEYHLFASGLHEPLGLLWDGKDLLVTQRAEVTRLQDNDGDGMADAYLTEAAGWGVTGDYHAYAYGPERDGAGHLWVTLNLGMAKGNDNSVGWRGWGVILDGKGGILPQSLGMRSPCGLGSNGDGDMFYSDQQGTWMPATPIHHLRPGVFYGNQESIGSLKSAESPFAMDRIPTGNVLYPEALEEGTRLVPPAVWLPYNKMGRSATDIQWIDAEGKFGPFDGQLLVGEFTNSGVSRVFLEKVGGEYQGACFPFLSGFPAAVVRLAFAPDGSLFVGMTNRGWSSLGNRSYGLSRVRWNGETPFAIREMRATPDGFAIEFTEAVDPATVAEGFSMSSFTYMYHSGYGGEEMETKSLGVKAEVDASDAKVVRLKVDGLRRYYVHELHASALKSATGRVLSADRAYYTLNRIPE
jgi:hypothetical protein